LLQRGAAKVFAIDVGKGILHWKLRNDLRVFVMEGTNARFVEQLPESVSFVSIDVSFISLKILLPVIKDWFTSPSTPGSSPLSVNGERGGVVPRAEVGGEVLALIKPQFEAGRKEVARGKGVVRDPEIHRRVLLDVLSFAEGEAYTIKGLARSPVLGPKGNVEFLAWLGYPAPEASSVWQSLVDKIVPPEIPGA
jgi:23S rRNA (cytidine1920-2'-O)/16S rRNA (cytidine1409-2'-O)-methyltransferase